MEVAALALAPVQPAPGDHRQCRAAEMRAAPYRPSWVEDTTVSGGPKLSQATVPGAQQLDRASRLSCTAERALGSTSATTLMLKQGPANQGDCPDSPYLMDNPAY